MRILVCTKQVRKVELAISIEESMRWICSDDSDVYQLNRADEFVIEEALLIKATFPKTTIDAISVGPSHAADALRRAMGMGVDNGVHIATESGDYLEPFVTASYIASYAQKKKYDLILAGVMSEDGMHGQTGALVAELISVPCATSVISERVSQDKKTVYVEREIEGGRRDTLELDLPAVLTVQTGINKPRYPSLSNIMRAKKAKFETINPHEFRRAKPRQEIARLARPTRKRSGTILEGTGREKAEQLVQILKTRALIS
ncbi:MAG: electron transfer flavoprotein subunit beta/FixA family protein [Proteobacteria bacterium]|nr:electron transfer flavoprotein subunit beta/FixA family protein [Pseudomonadota bacterium]